MRWVSVSIISRTARWRPGSWRVCRWSTTARADACGRRSVAMARAAGDPTVLLRVLLVRALGVWGPGTHDERIAIGEEMLTLPMDGELEVSVLWQYAAALHQAGRPGDAELIMDRCRVAAARLRPVSYTHLRAHET